MQITRRQFFKLSATGLGVSSMAALGFSPSEVLAEVRPFRLTAATQTRNICTYCAVGCGIIMYSQGDRAINNRLSVFHIEGDPDHPVSRGSLCPKGAALLDFIRSPSRLLFPEYRAPGAKEFKRVSWDWAMDRLARLVKNDRDQNIELKNAKGVTVNRLSTMGFLAASASSNETGYLTWKIIRSLGITPFDNQARV